MSATTAQWDDVISLQGSTLFAVGAAAIEAIDESLPLIDPEGDVVAIAGDSRAAKIFRVAAAIWIRLAILAGVLDAGVAILPIVAPGGRSLSFRV